MAQTVSHQSLIAEAQFQSHATRCEIFVGMSGIKIQIGLEIFCIGRKITLLKISTEHIRKMDVE
jgi:hypothetical protein